VTELHPVGTPSFALNTMGNSNSGGDRPNGISRRNSGAVNIISVSANGSGTAKYETDNQPNTAQFADVPPLVVYKDVGIQTKKSFGGRKRTGGTFSAMANVIIFSFLVYALFIWTTISSVTMQSIFVYLHVIKVPMFKDLTNLHTFGLYGGRNIDIPTSDGLTLKGWHLMHSPCQKEQVAGMQMSGATDQLESYFDTQLAAAKRIVLVLHGNGGTRGMPNRVNILKALAHQLSAHVVTFDYRGFGDSPGWPTEVGTHLDSTAAVEWVKQSIQRGRANLAGCSESSSDGFCSLYSDDNSCNTEVGMSDDITDESTPHLFLYGQSLGTGIGLKLASDFPSTMAADDDVALLKLGGVILDAAHSGILEASQSHPMGLIFRIFPAVNALMSEFLTFEYDSKLLMPSLDTSVLLLHGAKDWKIPPMQSRRLYAAAVGEPIDAPGAGLANDTGDSDSSAAPDPAVWTAPFREQVSDTRLIRFVECAHATHESVYKSVEWLAELGRFVKQAEELSDKK
jgi:pimeloyl-ACP methyl ester carboxylesterase